MTDAKDEPVFIVKLTGINSKDAIEEHTRRFSEVLPGRVVVVDGRVENIYNVTDEIQPRICQADETDTWECVCYGIGHYGERMTIHVMECSECGHTYEHVNGIYEYCPRCGRRIVEVADG